MTRFSSRITAALILALAAGAAHADTTFSVSAVLNAPSRPAGVVVADFNGDLLADIAVTTDTVDKISIFRNTGAGFTGPVNVPTGAGTGPDSLLAADLDGDGDQDLIVALKGTNTVRVYFNTAGSFAAGPSTTVGAEPRGMSMGNLDGTGAPDFAVANNGANTISTVRYVGGVLVSATFTVGEEPRGTSIADFNGDGLGDVAATNHRDRNITVLQNLGGGTLGNPATLNVGNPYRPEGVATLDIDGDGDQDIAAVASDDTVVNQVAVFRNNAGIFTGPQFFATGGIGAGAIAAADLDLDGDSDLAVNNSSSNSMAVLFNNGGLMAAPYLLASAAFPDGLAIGDVGGSTAADILVSNRDSNVVRIFQNDSVPCAADFNGDGFLNGIDYDLYVGAFEAGDVSADFDGDGFITGIDFDMYVGAFEAGC